MFEFIKTLYENDPTIFTIGIFTTIAGIITLIFQYLRHKNNKIVLWGQIMENPSFFKRKDGNMVRYYAYKIRENSEKQEKKMPKC